jgi:hypothetical protein
MFFCYQKEQQTRTVINKNELEKRRHESAPKFSKENPPKLQQVFSQRRDLSTRESGTQGRDFSFLTRCVQNKYLFSLFILKLSRKILKDN